MFKKKKKAELNFIESIYKCLFVSSGLWLQNFKVAELTDCGEGRYAEE